jgi:mevalonate kinase
MSSIKTTHKRGKLLISGAYAVMDGALALALPTKLGQRFEYYPIDQPEIRWQAVDHLGAPWYSDHFSLDSLTGSKQIETSQRLTQLFQAIARLQPNAFQSGCNITATLEFDRQWGLGTSSTLVSALAELFNVDPYVLLAESFGGSGYDIACANADKPLVFQHQANGPHVRPINFHPSFSDALFLVYLNQKMNSRDAIAHYKSHPRTSNFIQQVSDLTERLISASSLTEFEQALSAHESLLGEQLGLNPIGQNQFKDLPGVFSSLGAWGGDFALFSRKENIPSLKENGYATIFRLAELCELS